MILYVPFSEKESSIGLKFGDFIQDKEQEDPADSDYEPSDAEDDKEEHKDVDVDDDSGADGEITDVPTIPTNDVRKSYPVEDG